MDFFNILMLSGAEATDSIRYQGLHLDSRYNPNDNGRSAVAESRTTLNLQAKIMPNCSATRQNRRNLLGGVVHSIMLFGAPIDMLGYSGREDLLKVHRDMASRVIYAYRIVSREAALVIIFYCIT